MNEHLKWGIDHLETARAHFRYLRCRKTLALINAAIESANAIKTKQPQKITIHLITRPHSNS